jgi:hypothetical protein
MIRRVTGLGDEPGDDHRHARRAATHRSVTGGGSVFLPRLWSPAAFKNFPPRSLNAPGDDAEATQVRHERAPSARKRYGRDVAAGRASCWRCGGWIAPGSKWHVGHDDAGAAIVGPEHARYRVRAARARAYTNGDRVEPAAPTPAPEPRRYSRHWGGSDTFEAWCSECRRMGAPCGKLIVREW